MDLWRDILESNVSSVYLTEDEKKVDIKEGPPTADHISEDDVDGDKEDESTSDSENTDSDDSGEDDSDTDKNDSESDDGEGESEEESSDDGDTSGDESTQEGEPESDQSPEQDEGKNSKVNTIVLLDNFISLYRMIDNTIKKIAESRKNNILASVTFNQVRANLERLAGVVYKYITLYYDGNDHALNLYNFKYFMEILKLNLEMIRKVTSTNKETETSI